MMNVIVEDNKVRVLKVGDILMSNRGSHVCIVIEDALTTRSDCRYIVKKIDDAYSSADFCSGTLEELTNKAIGNKYSIYSQDEYELVIRKKA